MSRSWSRRRWLGIALHLLALVLVVRFLVLPQLDSSDHSLRTLMSLQRGWLAMALLAEAVSLGCATVVTYTVLPPGARPSVFRVVKINLSSVAFGRTVPDGGVAGTALGWRLLVGSGVPSTVALTSKLTQGVWCLVVLQALVVIGLLAGVVLGGLSVWALLPAVAAVVFLVLVALLWRGLRRPDVRATLRRRLGRIPRVGRRLVDGLDAGGAAATADNVRDLLTDPVRRARMTVLVACQWLFDAVALWAGLRAYGAHVGFGVMVTVYAVQVLGSWLPITPGGLGVSESMMIPALVAGGLTASAAAFGILAWRLVAYWLPIPVGALAYAWLVLGSPPRPRDGGPGAGSGLAVAALGPDLPGEPEGEGGGQQTVAQGGADEVGLSGR